MQKVVDNWTHWLQGC